MKNDCGSLEGQSSHISTALYRASPDRLDTPVRVRSSGGNTGAYFTNKNQSKTQADPSLRPDLPCHFWRTQRCPILVGIACLSPWAAKVSNLQHLPPRSQRTRINFFPRGPSMGLIFIDLPHRGCTHPMISTHTIVGEILKVISWKMSKSESNIFKK